MKSYVIKLREDTYNKLKQIKEKEGIPIVVSIGKAVDIYYKSKEAK